MQSISALTSWLDLLAAVASFTPLSLIPVVNSQLVCLRLVGILDFVTFAVKYLFLSFFVGHNENYYGACALPVNAMCFVSKSFFIKTT